MIFIEANCFLRFLTEPSTPEDRLHQQRAKALFALGRDGAVELTASDAILAEVIFILTNPRHYNGPRSSAATALASLLRPRTWRFLTKDVALHALAIWAEHPALGFPDALAAAYSALRGQELATFDRALARAPGVIAYQFE